MRVAIECAGFTASEADQLRRSMATFKFTGGVSHFRDKLISGMVVKGYEIDFAEKTFKQLEGFGGYGFLESHAASFALIAYASSWLKCHHPDVFCAALLNAQPMGFYAPAQIVRDARDHGVEVLPVCVNASRWKRTLEPTEHEDRFAVRLGLHMVRGLANADINYRSASHCLPATETAFSMSSLAQGLRKSEMSLRAAKSPWSLAEVSHITPNSPILLIF
jgi:error-prone DNA polymerase